jgi:hypothetical protein
MNMPDLDATHPAMPGNEIVARITEALERDGTHTWEDVRQMLICGDAQIFWNDHGAWITQVMVAPKMRWLHVWIVAGQLPGLMELQDQVETFCKTNTIERMVATTRPGWAVLTTKDGWEEFGWHKHGEVLTHPVSGV